MSGTLTTFGCWLLEKFRSPGTIVPTASGQDRATGGAYCRAMHCMCLAPWQLARMYGLQSDLM